MTETGILEFAASFQVDADEAFVGEEEEIAFDAAAFADVEAFQEVTVFEDVPKALFSEVVRRADDEDAQLTTSVGDDAERIPEDAVPADWERGKDRDIEKARYKSCFLVKYVRVVCACACACVCVCVCVCARVRDISLLIRVFVLRAVPTIL